MDFTPPSLLRKSGLIMVCSYNYIWKPQVWELSRFCPEPPTNCTFMNSASGSGPLFLGQFFGNRIHTYTITLFSIIATYFAMHKRTISLQASCPARVKSNKNIIYCCEEKDELPYFHLAFLLILENSQAYIYKTHTGYTITNCLHIYTTYTSTNSQQILHSIRCVIHII